MLSVADRPGRNAGRRPRSHAGRDDRLRAGIRAARRWLGERYPFANMVNAMREIHRGTHRPYPCGAGAGYLGVSADGELAACHRFVGDEDGRDGLARRGRRPRAPGRSGSPRGTFTGRSRADPAGRATCAAAAAITRLSAAAGPPATIFAAGCTIASRRICGCRAAPGQPPVESAGPWLRSASRRRAGRLRLRGADGAARARRPSGRVRALPAPASGRVAEPWRDALARSAQFAPGVEAAGFPPSARRLVKWESRRGCGTTRANRG